MALAKILAALLMAMALCEVSIAATVYHVGDSTGWTIGKVNYTLWSQTKDFVVGDTIIFEYSNQYHNVLQVTHDNFKSCNATAPIATFATGNDSITISKYGHFYYLCGIPGHCEAGQKVDIRVPHPPESPSLSPSPSPITSPSPSPITSPSPSPSPSPITSPSPSPKPWPSSPSPSPSAWPTPSSPPPSWGNSPAPAPYWGIAPAPAPSPASSLHVSMGLLGPSMAVLAFVVTAFAH
ncbi:Mavicyanin [Vitis vinifera]|uniref:Mavicyanin n=1 Tax=Vitis vinifera TaxID=29760 RepID=A0A438F4Q3_VITVI|nr:Mavicyanin [Vitis vinifera]